jgi:hypothetical protein
MVRGRERNIERMNRGTCLPAGRQGTSKSGNVGNQRDLPLRRRGAGDNWEDTNGCIYNWECIHHALRKRKESAAFNLHKIFILRLCVSAVNFSLRSLFLCGE